MENKSVDPNTHKKGKISYIFSQMSVFSKFLMKKSANYDNFATYDH